jgi:hypothetical protein
MCHQFGYLAEEDNKNLPQDVPEPPWCTTMQEFSNKLET